MKNNENECNKVSAQPLIYCICKWIVSITITVNSRKSKLQIHYKQHLSAFNKMSVLRKKLTNDTSDKYRCLSTCNNLNTSGVIDNFDFSSLVKFT